MRSIIVSLFLLISISALAQSLKTGEKLIYKVNFQGDEYAFAAKIQQLTPEIAFGFAITSQYPVCGTVKIKSEAQQNAIKMYNQFSRDEPNILLKDAVSVFPSKVMTNALTSGKPLKMDAGNGFMNYQKGETKEMEVRYHSYRDNSVKEENTKIKATELVSEDGKNHIWITTDWGQAVIVEMDLGWTIRIESFVSEMPLDAKPQNLLGKSLSSPELAPLYYRVSNCSAIAVEDLSDPGKPYVEKEYFSPMEGIRIKTHNDTLTALLFYTEGYEHEGFTWRGYNGKFDCGINLNMSYQEVDKTIGKPSTPRWPTDVLIQYPQQKLTVYYNMPDNDKNKKAIANAKINFIEFQ